MFRKLLLLISLALTFSTIRAQTVAYVTNFASNTVSVIDTSTNTVTATIPVGNGPNGVVASPDGTRVYVSDFSGSAISVIDTATNTVTATFPLPGTIPVFLAITPDGKILYVPTGNGSVLVIDAATGSVVTNIFTGIPVFAAAVTPNGSRVYVVTIS